MENSSNRIHSQKGNAVVIVLVVLAVVAIGALAYLSGQISPEDKAEVTERTISESTDSAAAEETDADTQTQDAVDTADSAAEEAEPAAGEIEEASAPAEQTEIVKGNPVVAKVNGEEINRLDVLNFLSQLPPNMRQMPIEQLFPLAQDQVINAKVIDQEVDAASVEDSEEVQNQLKMARQQILRNAYMQKVVDEQVTEAKLKEAYDAYIKEQPDVEEVKAAHILVDDEKTAKEIVAKLKDGGDFAALAKEYSKDNTAEKGGDLGYFAKADVVPEFGEAAFSMKEGATSKEPVKSQFGYHIIKLEEKRQRPKPTFEEAKPFLEGELKRALMEKTIEDWKNEKTIERFDINGDAVEPAAGEEKSE